MFPLSNEQKLTDSKALKIALLTNDMSVKQASETVGLSYSVLADKIVNRRSFKASEIYKLSKLLRLSGKEVLTIFFKGYINER